MYFDSGSDLNGDSQFCSKQLFRVFPEIVHFLVADTRLYTLPCRSVGPSVRPSVTFLNSERFLQYCSCPTVRDWIAVYPALFKSHATRLYTLLHPFVGQSVGPSHFYFYSFLPYCSCPNGLGTSNTVPAYPHANQVRMASNVAFGYILTIVSC